MFRQSWFPLPVVVILLESVATVDLAKQLVDELYQVTITCAAEGKLGPAGSWRREKPALAPTVSIQRCWFCYDIKLHFYDANGITGL